MKQFDPSIVLQIAVGLLIAVMGYAFNVKLDSNLDKSSAHTDAAVATLKQSITETYETQTAHSSDMDKIQQWNKQLSQGQSELKLSMQHITDMQSQHAAETRQN